jgi:hypothetical protein
MENNSNDAVLLYYGILEAYEDVGKELIGPDVVEKHIIRKMSYYIKNFIPDFTLPNSEGELEQALKNFLLETKEKIKLVVEKPDQIIFNNENVWELRAAIFGFESVFIELLGEHIIKEYVFSRIAEILSIYLPGSFTKEGSLEDKLHVYTSYLTDHKLVKYSNFSIKELNGKKLVKVRANKCIFAQIHDSEAYMQAKVRFCPWGMIGSSIVTSHEGTNASIESCQFVTRGTITTITEG